MMKTDTATAPRRGNGALELQPVDGAMRKRSVVIAGHRTSVSLENAFWTALKDMARQRGTTVNRLVTDIDRRRAGNLSSAIRVHILQAYRSD